MTDYTLNYRVLSEEERLLLFGKTAAKYPIKILKAKNLENYLELYERIYKGKETILSEFINEKNPTRVYIYCGNPAGSRVYSESKWSETCNFIYDTPSIYTKYYVNSLFIPIIKKATTLFTNQEVSEASELYRNVATSYTFFFETLQSGMFLNLYKGKIISANSYRAFAFEAVDRINSIANLPEDEILSIYNKLTFNLPTSSVKTLIKEELEIPSELIHDTSSFIRHRSQLIAALSPLFSWSDSTSITLGPDFMGLSGFTYLDNKVYTLLGSFPSKSPLNFSYNTASLTRAFDEVFSSQALNDSISLNPIFEFSNSSKRGYTSGIGNSFIFINSDNLTTTEISRSLGVEEYIELNSEFIDSIKQMYLDNKEAMSVTTSKEKFLKTEFAMKPNSMISEIESINRRYIPIKNKDKKIILLSKTSLAKEAAKKTAITRKISTAMAPVIDMAVRLFSIRDFETGLVNKKYNFKASILEALSPDTKYATGNIFFNTFSNPEETSEIQINDKLSEEFIKQLTDFKTTSASKLKPIAALTISDLYKDTSYEGTPFKQCIESFILGTSYKAFNRIPYQQQINNVFKHLLCNFHESFFSSSLQDISYFSPSSGNLNIFKLGSNIYSEMKQDYFRTDTKYLSTDSYYYSKLTGKLLYYLYSNNFLSTDQQQSDELECRKDENHVSLSNELIPYSNCFTYGQDVLDTFTALKKSKTFTDYYNWFKNVRPTLEEISKNILNLEESATHELNKLFLEQSELLLQELALLETPYLPVEVIKKRGHKAKDTSTTIVVEEVSNILQEGETNGESGTINE